jgi:hypothetical protein
VQVVEGEWGSREENNAPMYMIHAVCPLLFSTNLNVANYINMLLLCSCEVQVVQEGEGKGEG